MNRCCRAVLKILVLALMYSSDVWSANSKEWVQFTDCKYIDGEDRFLLLGMSSEARLLLVCHCERESGNIVRIISARKATKRESTFYGGQR